MNDRLLAHYDEGRILRTPEYMNENCGTETDPITYTEWSGMPPTEYVEKGQVNPAHCFQLSSLLRWLNTQAADNAINLTDPVGRNIIDNDTLLRLCAAWVHDGHALLPSLERRVRLLLIPDLAPPGGLAYHDLMARQEEAERIERERGRVPRNFVERLQLHEYSTPAYRRAHTRRREAGLPIRVNVTPVLGPLTGWERETVMSSAVYDLIGQTIPYTTFQRAVSEAATEQFGLNNRKYESLMYFLLSPEDRQAIMQDGARARYRPR